MNYYGYPYVRALGLREDTPSLEQLYGVPKGEPQPFCTSPRCCRTGSKWRGTRKQVEGRPAECPDCGHALVWKRI